MPKGCVFRWVLSSGPTLCDGGAGEALSVLQEVKSLGVVNAEDCTRSDSGHISTGIAGLGAYGEGDCKRLDSGLIARTGLGIATGN